jgi:hypothetical protein
MTGQGAYAPSARTGHDLGMARTRSISATPVVVFDLAVLRFEWGPKRSSISAWTPGRKLIGLCVLEPGVSDREAVFKVLDEALQTLVEGPNGAGKLALYNPFTAQIAYGAIPSTVTFTDREPIALDAEGTAAVIVDGELEIDGRFLEALTPSLEEVEFAFAAHRS